MARGQEQTPVLLNVYDLTDANEAIGFIGLGLFHSGVEIDGHEYCFASGAGVFSTYPKQAPGARYRETIDMGMFQGSARDARKLAFSLRATFEGSSYNLFTKNCNSYSEALCQLLLGKSIPAYINRAAYVGSFFSWLVPDSMVQQAPVDEEEVPDAQPNQVETYGFKGDGITLGDGASSNQAVSTSELSEAERREKVREAALRRFQNDPQQ